jgi:hypothetical protein
MSGIRTRQSHCGRGTLPLISTDFGLLISYVLPGFTALWGASYFSPASRAGIEAPPAEAPTAGGYTFVTLAFVAVGVTVSTLRWLVSDTIHRWSGLPPPRLRFPGLKENVGAYSTRFR